MLTITQRAKGNNWNPWQFFGQHLGDAPSLEEPGERIVKPASPQKLTGQEIRDAATNIQQRWETISRPTYATAAAKAISLGDGRPATTSGEHGTEWGTVIHALLEAAMRHPGANLKRLAGSALTDQGLTLDLVDTAVHTVRCVMESAVWQRATASPQRLVEVPFQTLFASDEASSSHLPTLLRGVIDLVFLEERGWVIVDYKTDRVVPAAIPALTEHYAPQVRTYANVWQALTGREIHEAALFFTHPNCYVPVLLDGVSG
jgi:ATP-dependent helicase/nuclease subunit A